MRMGSSVVIFCGTKTADVKYNLFESHPPLLKSLKTLTRDPQLQLSPIVLGRLLHFNLNFSCLPPPPPPVLMFGFRGGSNIEQGMG